MNAWKRTQGLGRQYGPYFVVAALVPGGSLFALALYVYRQRKASAAPAGK